MASVLPGLPTGQIAPDDMARLVSLMRGVQMHQASLKVLGQFRDQMTEALEDTLRDVATLEQQQHALRAIVQAKCGHCWAPRQNLEAGEQEPAVGAVQASAVDLVQELAGSAAKLQGTGSLQGRMVHTALQQPAVSSAPPSSRAPLSLNPRRVTTLMLRPVPRGFLQEELVAFWPPNCAVSPYNILYAPHRKTRGTRDGRKPRNGLQGYVFINFLSADAAERFRETWHGRVPEESELHPGREWNNPLEISEAKDQGFDENLRNLTAVNLDLLDSDFWPVVLVDGQRQNFVDVARSFRR